MACMKCENPYGCTSASQCVDYEPPPEPCAYVTQECNGVMTPAEEVAFLDISEDMEGRDVMVFQCSDCGQVHRSLIRG